MPRGSSRSGGLHFTKSGHLDMRYSSSKAAVASGYSTSSFRSSVSSSSTSGYSSNLHYKKDGSLDMRYSSSKQVVNISNSSSGYSSSAQLHYKKDGTLDMRYSSSKEVANCGSAIGAYNTSSYYSELHYKKDGTLDMRYKSSKVAASIATDLNKMSVSSQNASNSHRKTCIPSHLKCKGDGTPDMRTTEAKQWVAQQASLSKYSGHVPYWVPRNKDGKINMKTAIGRAFAVESNVKQPTREGYWKRRLKNKEFKSQVAAQRIELIYLPSRPILIEGSLICAQMSEHTSPIPNSETPSALDYINETYTIDYSDLEFSNKDENQAVLGKGSFGVVMKAKLNGELVAVKKLYLEQLTNKEKKSFHRELSILAHLGEHENLVKLKGYCLTPPCIVMELIKLGSLSYLLHYCEDSIIEARITDGRIKKKIIFGIANGMHQLHFSNIVHGDLKPQNVLITDNYEAKITDFGLAYFRGKSSSTIASKKLEDENDEEIIGGTAGYMAPELLDSTKPPEFSSDVYSFGIVLNELIAEEEPFSDQYANFAGRGPFGAANYARQGMRPTMSKITPNSVKQLITSCWTAEPTRRPTFERIISLIEDVSFIIPNSFETEDTSVEDKTNLFISNLFETEDTHVENTNFFVFNSFQEKDVSYVIIMAFSAIMVYIMISVWINML